MLLKRRHEKRQLFIVLNPHKNKDTKKFVMSDDVTSVDSHFEDNMKSSCKSLYEHGACRELWCLVSDMKHCQGHRQCKLNRYICEYAECVLSVSKRVGN